MIRCESQAELESALVFTYGNIKRQRKMNGWKEVRFCYYKARGEEMLLVGLWETEQRTGSLLVAPWGPWAAAPGEPLETRADEGVGTSVAGYLPTTTHVMPMQRI